MDIFLFKANSAVHWTDFVLRTSAASDFERWPVARGFARFAAGLGVVGRWHFVSRGSR
jgi:hypothetical protein